MKGWIDGIAAGGSQATLKFYPFLAVGLVAVVLPSPALGWERIGIEDGAKILWRGEIARSRELQLDVRRAKQFGANDLAIDRYATADGSRLVRVVHEPLYGDSIGATLPKVPVSPEIRLADAGRFVRLRWLYYSKLRLDNQPGMQAEKDLLIKTCGMKAFRAAERGVDWKAISAKEIDRELSASMWAPLTVRSNR